MKSERMPNSISYRIYTHSGIVSEAIPNGCLVSVQVLSISGSWEKLNYFDINVNKEIYLNS